MNETQTSRPMNQDQKQRRSVSLRTKILVGSLIIVLISIAAMGYFVFYRLQSANEFLVNQFDLSVDREIEYRLAVLTANEANDISLFFSSMENVIETFGNTASSLLSKDASVVLEDENWNAYVALKQLPTGSWDNSNEELGSIFLPANVIIQDDLAKELVALKDLDFFVQGLLDKNPDVVAIYFGGVSGETVYYPNIDLAAIVPPDFNVTQRPWYLNALGQSHNGEKSMWSVPYQDAALHGLVITSSFPIFNEIGDFRGVAGLDVQLATVTEQVSNLAFGKTGYGFLIDSGGRLIAMPTQGLVDFNLTEKEIQNSDIENLSLINRVPLPVFEVLAKMTSGQTGIRLVEINGSNRYIAYRPIPIVNYSLGIVVSEEELLQDFVETNKIVKEETRQTLVNALQVIIILLSVAGFASYGIGNSITAPLERLIKVAMQLASGDFTANVKVTTVDEIGILGDTLNHMSSTTQKLVTNLEDLVVERTKLIEKRFAQIQAVAEVGKAVAAQRDLEELLNLTTQLISSRFGFYHIGIFLLDPRSEYAILVAANSSGGKRMLAREHKLRVGTEGIVGTVAGSGEARIALDVGEDAIYFDNPDLPQTRSEMALPLIAGGEVLGVLDVQSVEANAFSADDVPTLQILADQLAIAVQNARMLKDTQEALFAARKATGETSQKGWQIMFKEVGAAGYVGLTDGEVVRSSGNIDDYTKQVLSAGSHFTSNDQHTLNVPIILRSQTIGMLRLTKPPYTASWTPDEISDMETLSEQISSTLESARLYNEAQRRAAIEQTIGEITSSIASATDTDQIIRETVSHLGKVLQDSNVTLRINTQWD